MNNKIKEYTVIGGNPLQDFLEKVNKAISEGWTPIGGVSSFMMDAKNDYERVFLTFFSQALVKYEE